MRLLQLAIGPNQIIDLHPNVSVLTGLDGEQRAALAHAISALAAGETPGPAGLLEAHGILFDLGEPMLGLLDLHASDLRPVVAASDLPIRPGAVLDLDDLPAQEAALADLVTRWAAAAEVDARAQAALAAASAAVDRAHRAHTEAHHDIGRRLAQRDALTRQVDEAAEQRGPLEAALSELRPRVAAATAQREAVERATAEVRSAKQSAAARSADVAAALDEATTARDPAAGDDLARAQEALAVLMTSIDADRAREAERAAHTPRRSVAELEARRAEIDEEAATTERALVALAPAAAGEVELALARLRAAEAPELVASPAALALADALDAIDAELGGLGGSGEATYGLPESRARLEDARQALLEAEQALRQPELDPVVVDQLEVAHADLLDALDKADRRFGGARAQRRVDERRSAEQSVLSRLGFSTYSDYMMGSSLFHVDAPRERALEQARTELRTAQEAWKHLQEQTDAELARAELLDRRRTMVEEARALLGRPAGATGAAEALRHLRVAQAPEGDRSRPLRAALERAGMALGDEPLSADDLVALAEVWLQEAGQAAGREQALRDRLRALDDERVGLASAIAEARALAHGRAVADPELERQARLAAAHQVVEEATARWKANDASEREVFSLKASLVAATEAEQQATEAAASAEAAVAAALAAEAPLIDEQRRVEEDLGAVVRAESEAQDGLRSLSRVDPEASPEALAAALADAEAARARASEIAQRAATALAVLAAERAEVETSVAALRGVEGAEGADASSSIGEEVEWYLLARLAAQRAVSVAGSLPLLLDDALAGLEEGEVHHVLGRLERMAEAVQVIVVSDDSSACEWALLTGADRAEVVRPTAR